MTFVHYPKFICKTKTMNRTGYVMYGAQCKMKMQGLLFENLKFPVVGESRALNQARELLRGGGEPGVLPRLCAHEEALFTNSPWTSFLHCRNLVFSGVRSLESGISDIQELLGHAHLGFLSVI